MSPGISQKGTKIAKVCSPSFSLLPSVPLRSGSVRASVRAAVRRVSAGQSNHLLLPTPGCVRFPSCASRPGVAEHGRSTAQVEPMSPEISQKATKIAKVRSSSFSSLPSVGFRSALVRSGVRAAVRRVSAGQSNHRLQATAGCVLVPGLAFESAVPEPGR